MISRQLEPELLDHLPPDDPRAIHSRRDLRLINAWMGNTGHLARAITSLPKPPRTIVELGTGDGTLMLKLAARISGPLNVHLLDMQPVVAPETVARFTALGWTVQILPVRLQDWLRSPAPAHSDLILSNLFLHHFTDTELRTIFAQIANITSAFIACDPRRWLPSLWTTHLLWLTACNSVTRHDARISIRAGFRDQELSALWPSGSPFKLREGPAGFASHLFTACS
jgi:hypothetical protein